MIVKISHVFIKSSNFSLELNLIRVHLLRVRLQSVDLVGNGLFIGFGLLEDDEELLVSELVFLALDVLVLVGFEQLGLTVFVLLVLTFEISELTVKFVQIVFFLLDGSVSLVDRVRSLGDGFFFVLEKTLNAFTSLIVIVDLNVQDINSFDKRVDVVVTSNLGFSEPKKRVVLVVSDFLLLVDESLLKLDFFSDVQIVGIVSAAL